MSEKNLIWLIDDLERSGVLDDVKTTYENESRTAYVIVVRQGRFFADCVTVNRLSRVCYHINCGSQHYYTRTSYEAVKIVKMLIKKIKFQV